MQITQRVIRPRQLAAQLGVSVGSVYRWETQGLLPERVIVGPNVSGWLDSEIADWLESRPRGSAGRRAASGSEARA